MSDETNNDNYNNNPQAMIVPAQGIIGITGEIVLTHEVAPGVVQLNPGMTIYMNGVPHTNDSGQVEIILLGNNNTNNNDFDHTNDANIPQ